MLLLKGAHPNARADAGDTPLHLAAEVGNSLRVAKLVVGGADKDSRNSDGETPLHLAARYGHLGAVEELLAAGANLDIRMHSSFVHYSALDMAAKRGHVEVVRAFLAHGSSVSSSYRGHTALHSAADVSGPDRDNGDVIRLLLEAGADIEARVYESDDGRTPLHVALSRRIGSSGTIRALLEGGADIHARELLGTPLHVACFEACVTGVELLLRWGADEKATSEFAGGAPEVMLEAWRDPHEDDAYDEQRKADEQCIRHMLARAPADRVWRRRGWLVLARSCSAKVQLVKESGGGGSGGSWDDASATGGERRRFDLVRLVGRVVDLNVEDVFRLVVGFL